MFKFIALVFIVGTVVSAGVPGAPFEGDPASPEVNELLTKVMVAQNSNHKLTKIVSVTKQVVAGVKYTVEFECHDSKSNVDYKCNTDFVSQPWITEEPQVLSYTCDNKV